MLSWLDTTIPLITARPRLSVQPRRGAGSFFHTAGVFRRAFPLEQKRAGNVIAPYGSQPGAAQWFISPKLDTRIPGYSDATGSRALIAFDRAKDAVEVRCGKPLIQEPAQSREYQRNRAVRA